MKLSEKKEFQKVKKTAQSVGAEILRFKNLKEPILTLKLANFFRTHVQMIYVAGLVALGFGLLAAIFNSHSFSEFFVNLAVVVVTFVIFRMLCELLSACGKGACEKAEKTEKTAEKAESPKAEKKAKK